MSFVLLSISLASSLTSPSAVANEKVALPLPVLSEEALFLRRIMEFWKDKEHTIVISQIQQFISQYPDSIFIDKLQVILGNAFWEQHQYQNALQAYKSIKSPELKESVFNAHLDCLYQLGHYETLISLVEPIFFETFDLPNNEDRDLQTFYYAEALLNLFKKDKIPTNLTKAQNLYHSLLDSSQKLPATLSLCELHLLKDENQIAINLYLELSETYPDRQEELLFQAAKIQEALIPQDAILTYSKIQKLRGKYASEATLNKIILFSNQKQHQQIIKEQEEFRSSISNAHSPLVNFYIGRSYFATGQYDQAILSLKPLISSRQNSIDQKSVLLFLAASAYHLNELKNVNEWVALFETNYPTDPAKARMLFFQALTYKNCDRFLEAEQILEKIIQEFPNFEKIEEVVYEKNVLQFKQRNWEKSRRDFLEFTQHYPSSDKLSGARQYIANSTSEMLEEAEKSNLSQKFLKEQLIADLESVLHSPNAISVEQSSKYLLKLSKTLYEMQDYQKAILFLKSFLANYPNDQNLYQAHLLMALCYKDGLNDSKNFAFHAEKVIFLKPSINEINRLHINLFSCYLDLAMKSNELSAVSKSEQTELRPIDKAANHLFLALEGGEAISTENQLWLANYFYDHVKEGLNEYRIEPFSDVSKIQWANKAVFIYKKAFQMAREGEKFILSNKDIYLEKELFKFTNLLGWENQYLLQIQTLQELINQQNEHSDWSWSLKSRTLFALANALQMNKQKSEALEIYKNIAEKSINCDQYVSNGTQLEIARLKYENFTKDEKKLDNPNLIAILKTLKDLQIKKSLAQEPIYLEAALEYALMRASLEPLVNQNEKLLFQLLRLKEEFTSTQNLSSKDYHANRKIFPEKDRIYQAYMTLVDAHIALLESLMAREKNVPLEAEIKREHAVLLYEKLLKENFYVSKYLINQAKSGLTSLNSKSISNVLSADK
jgi:tetratricopeptide (TPR) repeat protein